MQIMLKLYAGLTPFLPAGAVNNQIAIEVAENTTINTVLDARGCPRKMCHLVMQNGFHVPPGERDARVLKEGDALAAWPPIAGG
ncbi:MAG: MoaD/ThiS family protein [Alphaproteobacteria bacterium]|jgi:sulfur-carrier protein|nr:MoaD/ThiS family protein [Rhodospirillaceae bacterium]MBT6206354.1 MoaD/ThiS family protein [Rhodospirillaceae bacterium]MBT6510205.1 MoaD/ThiS family protein [Rhodospirillaceae bacterium]MBT7647874.1 MoaD/ThiS family protein [Rhodospirillaceae bacterium]MDG2481053.1 MoaD/ThiS family protein [Alphaproteobacteria bacterium]